MATRKQRLTGMHQADTKGCEWLLAFSRPLSQLEAQGVENLINNALGNNK